MDVFKLKVKNSCSGVVGVYRGTRKNGLHSKEFAGRKRLEQLLVIARKDSMDVLKLKVKNSCSGVVGVYRGYS